MDKFVFRGGEKHKVVEETRDEVFERRARQSRLLGVRLVRVKGVRIFLDELPPDADAPDDDIECGPVCQTPEVVDVG
jgi:hypothetical protein